MTYYQQPGQPQQQYYAAPVASPMGTPMAHDGTPLMYAQPQNVVYVQQPQPVVYVQQVPGMVMSPNQVLIGRRFPSLWPRGVGIVDRRVDDRGEGCSCPPICWCWSRPVFFSTPDFAEYGKQTSYCTPKPCTCGWEMKDADVLGRILTFEGRGGCCGVNSCLEPEVHVFENGRHVGHSVMKCFFCPCGDQILTEAIDAQGQHKFARFENPCCPFYRRWDAGNGCCDYKRIIWPITPITKGSSGQLETDPNNVVTSISFKFHPCILCHPSGFFVEGMPDVPEDDQKLLVSMAITRWWRMERERQQQNNNGNM